MKPIPQDIQTKADHEVLILSLKNPDYFSLLVDRYQTPFIRKVRAIVRDEARAQDIVQDTFVKIYVHAKKFAVQEGASFKSWAYKILLNTCFTHYKKMKRDREFTAALDPEDLALFGDSGTVKDFERKLTTDHFLVVASKLPVMLARVLTLVVIEGKTSEDIAKIEGITPAAARVRLHRAKKEFKKTDSLLGTL